MGLDVALDAARADASATDKAPVVATAASGSNGDSSAAEAPEESATERLRRDRHAFLKLLRDGVQRKVSDELHRSSSSADAGVRDDNNNDGHTSASVLTPDAQRSQRANSSSSNTTSAAWRTLAWRDAFSTEPFFEETVNDTPLRIQQILQGELNGFGTGLTVRSALDAWVLQPHTAICSSSVLTTDTRLRIDC